MIKQLCKVVMLSTVLLTIFDGGNSVYATNQGVYRGNFAVIEVDEDSPMTAIPDTGTWYNGPLNTDPQQYDVLVAARGNISVSANARSETLLDPVINSYETPDFFEVNSQRKLVVAEPKPMGTIAMPAGHRGRMQIELKSINKKTSSYTDTEKHIYLGIKKQGNDEYLSFLGYNAMSSAPIGVTDADALELIPLLSKSVSEYIAIEPGTEYPPSDSDYKPSDQFNFGAVFRVSVTMSNGCWVKDQPCYKGGLYWFNYGHMGVGPITDTNGQVHDNQLVAVDKEGNLARSSDGINWIGDISKIGSTSSVTAGLAYSTDKNIWVCLSENSFIKTVGRLSYDKGKSWSDSETKMDVHCVSYGNGIFMTADYFYLVDGANRKIYTSSDAVTWDESPSIPNPELGEGNTIFIYGNDRWIYGNSFGRVYISKDNGVTWENNYSDDLKKYGGSSTTAGWFGGCYAHGYFYVTKGDLVARSPDGITWEKVVALSGGYKNITFYKDKLYLFNDSCSECCMGIFYPDGSIDLEFDAEGNPI